MNRPRAGITPFARHQILRVNDLVPPPVAAATVLAALDHAGVRVGRRQDLVGRDVLAVVTVTRAGTVVTLQARSGVWWPRVRVLRRLSRVLDAVLGAVLDADLDADLDRAPVDGHA